MNEALKGRPACWVAPTYKYLLPQWREVCEVLRPIIVSKSEEEKHLTILGGGEIDCWSADGGTPGEGRKYSLVIFDECAMLGAMLEQLWTRSLRPTLADFAPNSSAWFLSTSKAANAYFNTLFGYGQGEREDWRSWQLGTADNPYISPDEIASARRDLPMAAFNQEFMGDAVSFSGSVFSNLEDAIIDQPLDRQYEQGASRSWNTYHQFFTGCDWAGAGRRAGGDFTVFITLAAEPVQWTNGRPDHNRVVTICDIQRFKADFGMQSVKLRGVYDRFRPSGVLAESNSIGAPAIDQVRRLGLRVQPWQATNSSKHQLVENLALGFERRLIRIPDIPNRAALLAELQAFEAVPLQNSMTRFAAPPGGHDDLVIGLMLAYWAASVPTGGPRTAWIA